MRLKLEKYIPEDDAHYMMFISNDWQNRKYAVISGKARVTEVLTRLKAESFTGVGLGSRYYCDAKYPDALIISRNNFFHKGQCQHVIDYLNIDSLGLEFNYQSDIARLNKADLRALMLSLDSAGTPYFVAENDTSDYLGRHSYLFYVTKKNRRLWTSNDRTGKRIENDLIAKAGYKSNEINYFVMSDSTLRFWFESNDTLSRLDSNLTFRDTYGFQYQGFRQHTYPIHYFHKVK